MQKLGFVCKMPIKVNNIDCKREPFNSHQHVANQLIPSEETSEI